MKKRRYLEMFRGIHIPCNTPLRCLEDGIFSGKKNLKRPGCCLTSITGWRYVIANNVNVQEVKKTVSILQMWWGYVLQKAAGVRLLMIYVSCRILILAGGGCNNGWFLER